MKMIVVYEVEFEDRETIKTLEDELKYLPEAETFKNWVPITAENVIRYISFRQSKKD